MSDLWEILVPKSNNEGIEFSIEFHKEWDAFVRDMSGGLTVMRSAKGTWLNDGKLYEDSVIPCRIVCSRKQILEVMDFTKDYYSQIKVMAYKISSEVIIA